MHIVVNKYFYNLKMNVHKTPTTPIKPKYYYGFIKNNNKIKLNSFRKYTYYFSTYKYLETYQYKPLLYIYID